MANVDKNSNNYTIERIRKPMDRSKLNQLYNEFKSDDDYLSYHLDNIEEMHPRYKVTLINDEEKCPIKNSDLNQSYGYMEKHNAIEFIEECIDNNRVSSKPKAVMQTGFNKKALDKYKALIEREKEECELVNEFTKPSFEDVMNNIYVNAYNGSTYHIKDNDIPDDLREDVGVIIPGLIDSKEDYFEFVKRLKDRGKNGLGRSIYERYEDYEEAKDLIERYKQALFDKYGGKEEFFHAKDMGGMFGAYEYYPTVKPRFKKTMRNIKLDRGINLNELAMVKDMGKRIWEQYEDEINQIEVDGYDYVMYENTPPKYKDLPDDLKMFYKTDKNNINGFTHTNRFKSYEQYANSLISSKDPDKQLEGYRILEDIKSDMMLDQEEYIADFVDISDMDDLTVSSVINQLQYDRLMSEYKDSSVVDGMLDLAEERAAYEKYLEYQLVDINGYDMENPVDKTEVKDYVRYASKYVFDEGFKQRENDKMRMNSVAESLYTDVKNVIVSFGDARNQRASMRKGDNKITSYVRDIADAAKKSLDNMNSNADNVNKVNGSTIDINDATGYQILKGVDGFELNPNDASQLLNYMKNNDKLAKKIYELSSDKQANEMFSERTNIDDFVNEAKSVSNPMITKGMIDKAIESNKNGRKGE